MGGLTLMAALAVAGPVVIEGVVEEQASRWQGGLIVTGATVRVDRVLAGDAAPRVVVELPGGAVDGIGQQVSGEAMLVTGEAVRLRLLPDGAVYRVDCGERGVERLDPVPLYVRTTTKSSSPPCPGGTAVPLRWRRVVVEFVLDAAGSADLAPDDAFAAVRASFATWTDVDCSYLVLDDVGTMVDAPVGFVVGGPNVNVVKWIESDWMQSSQSSAVTLNTFDCTTGELLDADVILNGDLFTFTTTPESTPMAADVQNTVTHELGHGVGFDHNPDPDSTMYAAAPLGEIKKRDLTADDALGLCAVYPPGDEPPDAGPPPAVDAAPPPALDDDGGVCGCRATRAGHGLGAAWLVALAMLTLCRRRGRRAAGAHGQRSTSTRR